MNRLHVCGSVLECVGVWWELLYHGLFGVVAL